MYNSLMTTQRRFRPPCSPVDHTHPTHSIRDSTTAFFIFCCPVRLHNCLQRLYSNWRTNDDDCVIRRSSAGTWSSASWHTGCDSRWRRPGNSVAVTSLCALRASRYVRDGDRRLDVGLHDECVDCIILIFTSFTTSRTIFTQWTNDQL